MAIFTLYPTVVYQILWIGGASILVQVIVVAKMEVRQEAVRPGPWIGENDGVGKRGRALGRGREGRSCYRLPRHPSHPITRTRKPALPCSCPHPRALAPWHPRSQSVVSKVLRIVRVAGSQAAPEYHIDTAAEEYQELTDASFDDGESGCGWRRRRRRKRRRRRWSGGV